MTHVCHRYVSRDFLIWSNSLTNVTCIAAQVDFAIIYVTLSVKGAQFQGRPLAALAVYNIGWKITVSTHKKGQRLVIHFVEHLIMLYLFVRYTLSQPDSYSKDRGPWIVKPVASSRGRGVYLINNVSNWKDIKFDNSLVFPNKFKITFYSTSKHSVFFLNL